MPKGFFGVVSSGGLPEITSLARRLGDYSSIKHQIQDPPPGFLEGPIGQRAYARARGRLGGRLVRGAQVRFGVWGLVGVAQGLAFVRQVVEAEMSKVTYVGTVLKYAGPLNSGTSRVKATYFWDDAVQASKAAFGKNKFGAGFLQMPNPVSKGGRLRLRGGLYDGQRFIGDFGSFFRGDVAKRFARRESGRTIAGFFWGTLRDPTKNILLVLGNDIVRRAKGNVYRKRLIDTGALYMSLVASDKGYRDFVTQSIDMIDYVYKQQGITRPVRDVVDVPKQPPSLPTP